MSYIIKYIVYPVTSPYSVTGRSAEHYSDPSNGLKRDRLSVTRIWVTDLSAIARVRSRYCDPSNGRSPSATDPFWYWGKTVTAYRFDAVI